MLRFLVLATFVALAFGQEGGRIVGGTGFNIEEVPYMVSACRDSTGLGLSYSHVCGASFVGPRTILSAAHCFQRSIIIDYSQPRFWRMRSGSGVRNSGGLVSNVVAVNNHPQYNGNTITNDITIIIIDVPVNEGPTIGFVALPPAGSDAPAGAIALVTGWGTTSVGGSASNNLLGAVKPIVDRAECKSLYASHRLDIHEDMVCAGLVGVGGVDACQGDSGGPLCIDEVDLVQMTTRKVQVGVVSWGDQCALAHRPGVYARVGHFRDFIEQHRDD